MGKETWVTHIHKKGRDIRFIIRLVVTENYILKIILPISVVLFFFKLFIRQLGLKEEKK